MSRGSLEDAWGVIEKIREEFGKVSLDVAALKIESAHCKKNQESTDKEIKEMCTQLKATETALRKEMKDGNEEVKNEVKSQGQLISADLKILMDSHLIRKGAESAAIGIVRHAPKIIWALAAAAFTAGIIWATR